MDIIQNEAEEFQDAILATGVADVVRLSTDPQISALCRVHNKRVWVTIIEYVLTRKTCWSAHICQQYFLRGGRLVYGWNFIVQPDGNTSEAIKEVVRLLMEGAKVAPRVSGFGGEISEFPLVGASPRRSSSKIAFDPRLPGPDSGGPSHKGAYPVGVVK